MFIDESNYECNTGCIYLQFQDLVFESQWTVTQTDGAELKTDGVQALQESISAYKRAGFPSQVNVPCFLNVIIKILLVTFYFIISSVSGLTIRTR